MVKNPSVATAFSPEAKLKRSIRRHFTRLGFAKAADGTLILPDGGKDTVRRLHSGQRTEKLRGESAFISRALSSALPHFADGDEIDPSRISLRLLRVEPKSQESDLFRFASLTWSVPVSTGFGRRLRYIVWDEYHGRIAGIFALGDPVFNLSVRDNLVGWTASDRSKRLVNVLDAYVLGALPPYNMLLCGKAVACLMLSREVFDDFRETYGKAVGIISQKAKRADLLMITTTSSMGRSSVYNRLRLGGTPYLSSIGYTVGWGHFHITSGLFAEMREYLRLIGHPYADQHRFGDGPNWRFRTIRTALAALGINEAVLRHGVRREVFVGLFGPNALELLKTGKGKINTDNIRNVSTISELAKERWIIPRANRREEYMKWKREDVLKLIQGQSYGDQHRKQGAAS